MHLTLNIIIASSSLTITSDKNISSSCPAKIEALFIAFPVFRLSLAKAVDRFFAVFSTFTKSLS
jgi:hypothetical protein